MGRIARPEPRRTTPASRAPRSRSWRAIPSESEAVTNARRQPAAPDPPCLHCPSLEHHEPLWSFGRSPPRSSPSTASPSPSRVSANNRETAGQAGGDPEGQRAALPRLSAQGTRHSGHAGEREPLAVGGEVAQDEAVEKLVVGVQQMLRPLLVLPHPVGETLGDRPARPARPARQCATRRLDWPPAVDARAPAGTLGIKPSKRLV